MMPDCGLRTISFMGMNLLVGTSSTVADWMAGKTPPDNTTVAHINFYSYWIATRREPAADYEHYALVFEGIGMKLAAWILGHGWLPDANGTDMYPMVMEHATRRKLRVFLLGGTPSVIEATIRRVRLTYPQVRLCGARSGYFADSEVPEIIERIRSSAPDLLLISRGSSLHADFISRCRKALHVGLIWNTGGLFDFVSGRVPRAPKWMRKVRIEWLFRLLIEPFRKGNRIFVVAPWFLTQVVRALWIRDSRASNKESVQLEIEK